MRRDVTHGEVESPLRDFRELATLTQEELAERAGVSVRSISNIERGIAHTPRLDTLRRLADALQLTAEQRQCLRDTARPGHQAGHHTPANAQSAPPTPASPSAPPSALPRSSLPVPATALIGRGQEMTDLADLLIQRSSRLLTITGVGGVGKTLLALHVAGRVHTAFASGATFISLARLHDADTVLAALAQALGLREAGDQPIGTLLHDSLRNQELLLVLDNCEQLLPALAPLLADLLATAPRLMILATSRVALHMRGEVVYLLAPLGLPAADATAVVAIATSPAIQLFVERVRALNVATPFVLDPTNAPTVAAICRRLDGLPLAIELAAARSPLFSLSQLLERLTTRLALLNTLTVGATDLPHRQQTLRNTLAWSYALLPPPVQWLFRRLAVCVGGCTASAVEALGQPLGRDSRAALDLLAELVDQHVLQRVDMVDATGTAEGPEGSSPRFRMLETIREFASEQLDEVGETQDASEAHLAYYCAVAERARPELYGANQARWLTLLDRELENFRAALRYSLSSDNLDDQDHLDHLDHLELGLRLARALTWYWQLHGYLREGRTWFASLLARVQPSVQASGDEKAGRAGVAPLALAYAYNNAGLLAQTQGALTDALALYEASLAVRRQLDDVEGVAKVLNNLAIVYQEQGEYAQATRLFEQARAAYPAASRWPNPIHNLGVIALYQGDVRQAANYFGESLELWEQAGDRRNGAIARANLADALRLQGADQQAEQLLQESLSAMSTIGDHWGRAVILVHLGMVAHDRGRCAEAETSYQTAWDIFADQADPAGLAWAKSNLGAVASVQEDWRLATAEYSEGLAGYRMLRNRRGCAWALCGLSQVQVGQGSWAEALAPLQECLSLFVSLGDQVGLIHVAETLARLDAGCRQPHRAIQYWATTTAARQQRDIPRTAPERALYEKAIIELHASVGEEAFDTQWRAHFDATFLITLLGQRHDVLLP